MNREEFLSRLHKESVLAEGWIKQLKKEELPLIIWGCGDVADAVCDYLEKNDIKLSGVWVDGADGSELYRNMQVLDVSGIINQYEKFNVILGHSNYEKGEILKEEKYVNKVFYAFSIHYGQYECVKYAAIEKEAERFAELCDILQDDASVRNLFAYLNTKMTGDVKYIFDVYEKSMSFYQNDVFSVTGEEVFLDIGAYNGDTIRSYLQVTNGSYKRIIALEPDSENYLALSDYVAKERLSNITTSLIGAWNEKADLMFVTGNKQISSVCDDENAADDVITIYADRIDRIFTNEEISFIKINYYEGVLEAIQGCEGLIKKHHPKLAIDVGFDIYNVLRLSEYIAALGEGYKIYLRFNRAMSSTFTMYCI